MSILKMTLLAWLLCLSGCGYGFQTSKGMLLKADGVERIYIAPIKNRSFKPGIENLAYNKLVQVISAGRRIRLVDKASQADAIMEGEVKQASYQPNNTTSADSIYPTDPSRKTINIVVAVEYLAYIECHFTLKRVTNIALKDGGKISAKDLNDPTPKLWESGFTRSRRFPGNNQKGEYGTTSPLINESEFDRALDEMFKDMMQQVHESLLAMF